MSSPRKTSSALNKQRKWRGVDLAGAINSQSVPKGGDLGILMGVGVLPWHCTVTVHSVKIKHRHPNRSLTRMCWQWMKGGWKKIYMYHILSPLIFLKATLWMWLGCIFLIAFCSTSFVLIYIEYIIYSCILEHISSCLFNKRTERQNTPTSSDVMNTNRVQPHLEQTTSQSWQFHQNNNFMVHVPEWKLKKECLSTLFAWAFLSLVMHARYRRFNPLKWKVIMFSWLGVKTTQQGFIPPQSYPLGNQQNPFQQCSGNDTCITNHICW